MVNIWKCLIRFIFDRLETFKVYENDVVHAVIFWKGNCMHVENGNTKQLPH